MDLEEDEKPPFLPKTLLFKDEDVCFVHYQTPGIVASMGDNEGGNIVPDRLGGRMWNMPGEVSRIRARQESEVVKLIEAHLSEPYTITFYSCVAKRPSGQTMLQKAFEILEHDFSIHFDQAYKGSLLVGAVVCKVEFRKDEVCMLHELYSPKLGSCRGSLREHGQGADESICASIKRMTLDGEVTTSSQMIRPNMSRKQMQMGCVTPNEIEQRPRFPSTLCKCQGQFTANIGMLAVRPEMRGRGIGKHLVRLALQQQKRFVWAMQNAALAAAPTSPGQQRTIYEVILAGPAAGSLLCPAMMLKVQEVQKAVEHFMAATSNVDAPEQNKCGISGHVSCGLKHCCLDMEAGNAAALRVYTSVGFVIARYRRRYYCNGKDAYKMVYVFRP